MFLSLFYIWNSRAVMASGIVPHVISALTPDAEFGYGPAIECTWCLHYLVSRCGLFSFHKNLLNNDRVMESSASSSGWHEFSFNLYLEQKEASE